VTTNYQYPVSQLDWLLDDLVLRVAHIHQAVFLSQDGLALGASRGLDQADAEHLAALAAGFQSLARGAGRHFGGGEVRQTIIEMTSGFLFVTAAGQGTCLAVLTGAEADVGLVAYEMAVLVQRTGDHLKVNMRTRSALSVDEERKRHVVLRRAVARCRGRACRSAVRADPGQDAALRRGIRLGRDGNSNARAGGRSERAGT
jgi:predicted regulator of Ras-like GTPase activity (Roadblock/LC7/MglB family)